MSKAKAYKQKPFLTADVTLPGGAVFTLRRPPLESWVTWGKVPDFLLHVAPSMDDLRASSDGATPEELNAQNNLNMAKAAIIYAVVDPVLKIGATEDEDAIDPTDIEPEDMAFLFDYVLVKGCPDVPVRTAEGQVSVESLKTFQQSGK